jgi:short-subunit dehydrogenase
VLPADISGKAELAKIEAALRDDPTITVLVNNAGRNE